MINLPFLDVSYRHLKISDELLIRTVAYRIIATSGKGYLVLDWGSTMHLCYKKLHEHMKGAYGSVRFTAYSVDDMQVFECFEGTLIINMVSRV